MNKGLEALENIKGNCDLFDEGYQWDNEFSKQFDSDIDTIENELKDYYALKKECEEAKWYQEHKAFEIIRNIGILKPYETSGGQCWLETMCDATKITKDNYDLLKEVGL